MGKKIIVAGLGHGGIAAAAQLSAAGYDVTVYEQKSEGTLGYDWTDIFAPDAMTTANIPMFDDNLYTYKEDMTFFGPLEDIGYSQHVPSDNLEIKLERKDIYAHLINYAVNNGVKIVYNCKVTGPVILGSRVIGITTDKGNFYGDLIIDSCGMNSPVRMNLPDSFGIDKVVPRHEYITIFRAFYNKASDEDVKAKFKVILLKEGITGVSWIATEEDHTDLLIGRFEDFDMNEVNRVAELLRKTNPSLGTELVRGGQFVKIPTRQPLSVMVADGYAAIGDSAFMTVPIIGSGIANSLRASRILTDTILDDKDDLFNTKTLWKYQYNFFRKLGSGLAPLACAKLLLLKLNEDDVNYVFTNGLISEENVTIGADFTGIFKIKTDLLDIIEKAKKINGNMPLIRKLVPCGIDIAKATAVCVAIPRTYSPEIVKIWSNTYKSIFRI